jgi:hypothetical protein
MLAEERREFSDDRLRKLTEGEGEGAEGGGGGIGLRLEELRDQPTLLHPKKFPSVEEQLVSSV